MIDKEEMLRELTRLNREGTLNDEEFVVIRRLLREPRVSERTAEEFARLFLSRSTPPMHREDDCSTD